MILSDLWNPWSKSWRDLQDIPLVELQLESLKLKSCNFFSEESMEIFLETFFLEYRTKYLAKSLEEFEEVKLIPVRIPKQIPERIPEETVGKISEKNTWKYH